MRSFYCLSFFFILNTFFQAQASESAHAREEKLQNLQNLQLYPTQQGFVCDDKRLPGNLWSEESINSQLEELSLATDGFLYFKIDQNSKSSKLADTKGKKYLYVLDIEKNIFICPETLKHSDLVYASSMQGWPICAGHIKIKQGKVVYLDNFSTHYRPNIASFDFFIDLIQSYKQDPLMINVMKNKSKLVTRFDWPAPSLRRAKLRKILANK